MDSELPRIPFSQPRFAGRELEYLGQVLSESGRTAGNGEFTARCQRWLTDHIGSAGSLLTPSCTAALEMTTLLAGVGPGAEVIMPSFTFVSTANAVALRGATPVFVDIRSDTLNLDEALIEDAITERTRAIVVVHYAGIGCEMDSIVAIGRRHELMVIEDSALGFLARYRGRSLGALGDFGTLSFHESKNVVCGEGGALLVNDPEHLECAEVIWEKGTDRSRFLRGEIDRYTWQELGSSYLPSEITAAVLLAQLERAQETTALRRERWNRYHDALEGAELQGYLRRPVVPAHCEHNGQQYHVLLESGRLRDRVLEVLRRQGVEATFHYVPLHSSAGGQRYGRAHGSMTNTAGSAARIVRLPLWPEISDAEVDRVVELLVDAVRRGAR